MMAKRQKEFDEIKELARRRETALLEESENIERLKKEQAAARQQAYEHAREEARLRKEREQIEEEERRKNDPEYIKKKEKIANALMGSAEELASDGAGRAEWIKDIEENLQNDMTIRKKTIQKQAAAPDVLSFR